MEMYDGGIALNPVADDIREELRCIESANDVVILYAAESGSRAWGFASGDSDFDVRFIYVHKPSWYLMLAPKKDVIKDSYKDLDLSGWDLQKALKLFRKNNPPLLEWLNSPIVYKNVHDVAGQLREWKHPYFSQRTSIHCYLSLAKSEYNDIRLEGNRVSIKKYLYVLRSLFACSYVNSIRTWPPMQIQKLMQVAMPPDEDIRRSVELILEQKRNSETEMVYTDRLKRLDYYIEVEMDRFESITDTYEKDEKPIDWNLLNDLFRITLDKVFYPVKEYDGGEEWPHKTM